MQGLGLELETMYVRGKQDSDETINITQKESGIFNERNFYDLE